jgi:hypothetical protein
LIVKTLPVWTSVSSISNQSGVVTAIVETSVDCDSVVLTVSVCTGVQADITRAEQRRINEPRENFKATPYCWTNTAACTNLQALDCLLITYIKNMEYILPRAF